MRAYIQGDPFEPNLKEQWWGGGCWPGRWVSLDGDHEPPYVSAYRLRFVCESSGVARVHVSGDERYTLYLDGHRVGTGPERGDPLHWRFETYDLPLEAGEHVLVARVDALGEDEWIAPSAQFSVRPGFLLAAEGAWADRLSTARAPWEAKRIEGFGFIPPPWHAAHIFAGGFQTIDGRSYPWGYEAGEGEGWSPVVETEPAQMSGFPTSHTRLRHVLKPATLPPMFDAERDSGAVRHAEHLPPDAGDALAYRVVETAAHDPSLAESAQRMLDGDGSWTIAPNQSVRLLLDAEEYVCAYPELTLSGGRDASVRVHWAESLYLTPDYKYADDHGINGHAKGHRDEIERKYFRGKGDLFTHDGASDRCYTPLWWRAGRYIEVVIRTADEPLTINAMRLRETHYPLDVTHRFGCDSDLLTRVQPILERGLLMCMHETYMDCPHFEQLMYVGDTRLEVLATYAVSRDDRLPRKAIRTFFESRRQDGLTASRYPCYDPQVIPPFSLWWVGMVYDFARWRDDPAFVREMMPCVRSVLEAFLTKRNGDGLIGAVTGWNYTDWVEGWKGGMPPEANEGVSGVINWHVVYTLRLKAELEDHAGEPELAARDRRLADELADVIAERFWDDARGLYADDLARTSYSEHAQCLALLSGVLDEGRATRCLDAMLAAEDLHRTTIYFSFYLLETLARFGRMSAFFARLEGWRELLDLGMKTPLEKPEPSRSDCHAWGSHPLFHLHASVLGVRPDGFGFQAVTMTPRLGPLKRLDTVTPHPNGDVVSKLRREGDRLTGTVMLPDGLTGTLHANGITIALNPGENVLD